MEDDEFKDIIAFLKTKNVSDRLEDILERKRKSGKKMMCEHNVLNKSQCIQCNRVTCEQCKRSYCNRHYLLQHVLRVHYKEEKKE
jgi:hypothetical protein